jgi:hypothetical protein
VSKVAMGPSNKGMKLTSAERIGRSQLIPGVRRTIEPTAEARDGIALAPLLQSVGCALANDPRRS